MASGRAGSLLSLSLATLLATLPGCSLADDPPDLGGFGEDTGNTDDGDEAPSEPGTSDTDTNADGTDADESESGDTGGAGVDPIHVDIDAPDGGDGLSWETARNDLRATVEALDFGGVVWVAEGVYEPPDVGEVLRVGPGVQIYGGFAGTETALAQRDLTAHTTTLRQTGPEDVVVIDGFGINSPLIRLDGLEISGAPELSVDARGKGIRSLGLVKSNRDEPQIVLANLDIHDTSGGLIVQNFTTVELHGSSIHHNVKAGGGVAIYQSNSWLRIHDSSIVDNQNTNPGAYGVILHYTPPDNSYFGSLEAWNTTIANNVGAGISGARVHLHGCTVAGNTGSGAHATLSSSYEDCEFRENMGGGVGGSHLDVDRCRFIGNQSDYGGALYAGREVTVRDSVFIGNVATEVGGAIVAWASEFGGGDIDIFDSSFVGNSAKKGGAIYAHAVVVGYKARVDVINGQFIANTAEEGGALYGPAHADISSFSGNVADQGAALASFVEVFGDDAYPFPGKLHACAMWPDQVGTAVAHEISDSCFPAGMAGFEDDGGNIELATDPFEILDLDDDGIDTLYLDPSSPCVDIGGYDYVDWSLLTTQASQCTDAGTRDAGAHFVPLQDAGACG